MTETITLDSAGQSRWMWWSMMFDLQEQGGLKDIVIYPLSCLDHSVRGQHKDNKFYFSWMHNKFLVLSMENESQELVDAFSKVIEYQPFAKYLQSGITFEWDKVSPESRWTCLVEDEKDGLERTNQNGMRNSEM